MSDSVIDPTMIVFTLVLLGMMLAAFRGVARDSGIWKAFALLCGVVFALVGLQALGSVSGGAEVTQLTGWSFALAGLLLGAFRVHVWLA